MLPNPVGLSTPFCRLTTTAQDSTREPFAGRIVGIGRLTQKSTISAPRTH